MNSMKQIYDEDSANAVYAENKLESMQIREKHNHILKINNPLRKQQAYNELYPRLAIEGLTEEELNIPW